MAESPRFMPEDVERILLSLLPSDRPDILGEMRELLLSIQEDVLEGQEDEIQWREKTTSKLNVIQTQAFGVFLLKLIKVIRLIIGLLPAGRIILILLTVGALVEHFLEGKKITGGVVRDAVEKSGLDRFINEQLQRFQDLADEAAGELDLYLEPLRESLQAVVTDLNYAAGALRSDLEGLPHPDILHTDLDATEYIGYYRSLFTTARGVLDNAVDPSGNLVANIQTLVLPVLDGLGEKIRAFPVEAKSLLE